MTKRREESRPDDYPEEILTDHIKIDVTLIPDYVRDTIAATLLAGIRSFLREPGGREFLEAKKAQYRNVKDSENK